MCKSAVASTSADNVAACDVGDIPSSSDNDVMDTPVNYNIVTATGGGLVATSVAAVNIDVGTGGGVISTPVDNIDIGTEGEKATHIDNNIDGGTGRDGYTG